MWKNEGIIIDESVSGNSSGVPVTEGGEAVSGNGTNISHMEDGKWIDEEMMSEEERALSLIHISEPTRPEP